MKFYGIQEPEAPVLERPKRSKRNPGGFALYTDQSIPAHTGMRAAPERKNGTELSTFNIIVLLVIAALVITAYITNIIHVDALMMEYTKLERQESKLLQVRENLRADINSLTSYNRIQKIATEELGLVHSRQQSYSLEITE